MAFQQNQFSIFGEKYQQYFLDDSIAFLKLMMITVCFNGFIALLVFVIQDYNIPIIALMAAIICISFLSIFQIHRFKSYIQTFLALLHIVYVTSAIFILILDLQMPRFISGYGTGIIQCGIIQFCFPKFKLVFVFVTPWLYFTFTNIFTISQLHYITFVLSASSLLGLVTYQFEAKKQLLYSQSIMIKNLQEIIKSFTSDYLFAISYNDRDRQFKLEFANTYFENLYQDDIKQILRMYFVVSDLDTINQKKNFKNETLEEYLFSYNQVEKNNNNNSHFNLKIRHMENEYLKDISVLKSYLNQPIFVISIKQNLADLKLQKYEDKLKTLQETTISLLSDAGKDLQSQYYNLNKLIDPCFHNKLQFCKLQQSNILSMLIRIKNFLIYFQSHKLQIFQTSIKIYQFQMLYHALLSYFEIQCKQKNRFFNNISQIDINQNYLLTNSQSLLTQILINVFNIVLRESSAASTIQFSVAFDENINCLPAKLTKKTNKSNNLLTSSEQSQIPILQFKYVFACDHEIENFDSLLCKQLEETCVKAETMIVSLVNYLILGIIGPYSEIYTRTFKTPNFEKQMHEVAIYVYSDQTKLDSSYIKQVHGERQI